MQRVIEWVWFLSFPLQIMRLFAFVTIVTGDLAFLGIGLFFIVFLSPDRAQWKRFLKNDPTMQYPMWVRART
jgi:hypothetical protein